jgi:predicted cytidylate kinase
MRITISGPPGSGKTTVCRELSDRLGLQCIISGELFRQMAQDQGKTLAEFGLLAESDPSYDRMLDDRMVEIARDSEDILLEGRLTAHMLTRSGLEAFRVLLDADLDERCRRVSQREGIDEEVARDRIVERERCEAARYLDHYDIDIEDRTLYDLVVDTTSLPPEEVVEIILEGVRT